MRKRVSLLLAICSTNVFDYRLFVCFQEGFIFIYTLIKCIEKENHHIFFSSPNMCFVLCMTLYKPVKEETSSQIVSPFHVTHEINR